MTIGIVLSRPPGNSEIFFRNKIIALQEKGVSVRLYVEKYDKSFHLCPQYSLPGKNWIRRSVQMLFTFILNPVRCFRFYILEKKDQRKIKEVFKNLLMNMHLLNSANLDWVHFGFATMSVGRENIAAVIHAKMAVSLRGFDISRYPLRHPGIYRLTWQKTNKIHTISDALVQKAFLAGLPTSVAVSKITPAIDTKLFNGGSANAFRTPLRLLTVGRLHWSKGFEYTLGALAILQQQGIDFTYTIAGEGKDHERLVLAAHQLGISNRVIFAGNQEHQHLPGLYANCDIYLQYSVQEGFCNAALEAQAMGLLCVVSDAEGLPENVLHEETGWVVPRRSPEKLATQIIDLLKKDPAYLNRIRENAKKRVAACFNLEKQAAEFVKFYEE